MNTDLRSSMMIECRYGAASPVRYRGFLKAIRSLRFVLVLSSLLAPVTTLAAQEITQEVMVVRSERMSTTV